MNLVLYGNKKPRFKNRGLFAAQLNQADPTKSAYFSIGITPILISLARTGKYPDSSVLETPSSENGKMSKTNIFTNNFITTYFLMI
jgi:hypothetical protein